MDSGIDDGAQGRSRAMFLHQDTSERCVCSQRPHHMVRVAFQTIAAQVFQVVELPMHAAGRWTKEFAEKQCATVLFFVQVDLVALDAEDAKIGYEAVDSHLRKDLMRQVAVKRIAGGEMPDILS